VGRDCTGSSPASPSRKAMTWKLQSASMHARDASTGSGVPCWKSLLSKNAGGDNGMESKGIAG
jgi:hypothetical protein